MATTTPNFGWPVPTSTDLVKDGATAIEGLGDAIDASLLDLKGGTTNQVLAKNSNTDMDFKWVADASGIPATIIDAKGDLIAGTAADTAARLPVGTNGQVLKANSATATGLEWGAAGGGSPLTTKGDLYTYSTADARLAIGADFGFLQADSAAATGNKWNDGAWTTYTPTLTSSSGTATTTSVTGRYIRIGKLCIVENDVYITNKGTASGNMMVTLPFTARANAYVGSAMENSVIGVVCRCYVAPSENKINLVQYDGASFLWSNGYGIYSTIAYEVA